jgi:hypothetical protein
VAARLGEGRTQRVQLRRRHGDIDRAFGHREEIAAGLVKNSSNAAAERSSLLMRRRLALVEPLPS